MLQANNLSIYAIFLGGFSVSRYPGGVMLCFHNIFSCIMVLRTHNMHNLHYVNPRISLFSHTYILILPFTVTDEQITFPHPSSISLKFVTDAQLTLSFFDSSISSSLLRMHKLHSTILLYECTNYNSSILSPKFES